MRWFLFVIVFSFLLLISTPTLVFGMQCFLITITMFRVCAKLHKWSIEILSHMMQFYLLSRLCINRRSPFGHELPISHASLWINIVHINFLTQARSPINLALFEVSIFVNLILLH